MDIELENKVLLEITNYSKLTGGKCGLNPMTLPNTLNRPYVDIRPILIGLLKRKAIKARKGINNNLIFLP